MTIKEKLDFEINKFLSEYGNDFEYKESKKISSILLFKDYIRRLKTWKEALNNSKLSLRSLDGHNLFLELNPSWKDELMTLEDFCFYLKEKYDVNNLPKGRYINYLFIYLFIYWEVFKDTHEIQDFKDFPHPYEGVVKIIRNRDYIFIKEGVNVSGVTINKHQSLNCQLHSIEDDFLDYIDSKYKLEKFDKIPNQDDLNLLWHKFQEKKY